MAERDVAEFREGDHVDVNLDIDGSMVGHLPDPVGVLDGHDDIAPAFKPRDCKRVGLGGDENESF